MSARPLPWFRAYTEMVDDEKLRLLAFEDRWHYVALLCCKGQGLIDAGDARPMLERKLAVKLGLQLRELETVVMRLAEVGLIDSETFQPTGWDGRQFVSDTDPTAAERKRRQRERVRAASRPPAEPTGKASRVTVTEVTRTDTDTELDPEQEQKITPRKRGRAADAAIDLPDWVPADLWDAWLEVRRKIRAPNTAQALRLNLNKLAALRDAGQEPAAILEQAISRGWRGIFPLKDQPHDRPNTGSDGRRESTLERTERFHAELDRRDGLR